MLYLKTLQRHKTTYLFTYTYLRLIFLSGCTRTKRWRSGSVCGHISDLEYSYLGIVLPLLIGIGEVLGICGLDVPGTDWTGFAIS
jgi:hypothetical protein